MVLKESFDGWILDVSTSNNGVELWVKTSRKKSVVKIFTSIFPEFFVVPKKHAGKDLETLKEIILQNPKVESVRSCERYVQLEDSRKRKILGVSVKRPSFFKSVINDINKLDLFVLYNTDLPISQMFFYVNDFFPMAYCQFITTPVKKGEKGILEAKLLSITLKDDNTKLFYELPPLSAVWLDVKAQQRDIKPYFSDPISFAEISIIQNDENNIPRADGFKERKIIVDEGDEIETLKKLSKLIEKIDPDIILTQGGDEFIFPYLAERAAFNEISKELYFSRDKTPLRNCIFELSSGKDHYMSYGIIRRRSRTQVYFTGRLHLDTSAYASLHFTEGNIPGVIEVARVSRVPLQRLCRVTIGGALQSIQFYNAYKLGYLIPPFKKNPEGFHSAMDLIRGDRGGHIFEPLIGVFERVAELDFSSMYPSLMAHYNISSETINCKCCKEDGTGIKVPGLNYHVCSKKEGIIAKSIKLPLEKRLKYKEHVKKTGDMRYKYIDIALKWVLVVSFGYLGFKNARFGKIEAHQTVCAFAREFLLRSAEIAKKYGCRIIHGIVDSMWLQDTQNRDRKEFEKITKTIASEITRETRIPMSWDGMFDFIVFLPSRAHPEIPTLSHYWGIKENGEIKARGVEVRRRDVPTIIKEAQLAIMNSFKGVKTVEQFKARIPIAKKILMKYAQKIKSGDLSTEHLTIKQRISRKPSQYKVNSYQAVAARQLEQSGILATPGKNVHYVILNAEADTKFSERKVIIANLHDTRKHGYDKKKYLELLKRAFENLFPFKFPEIDNLLNFKSFPKNFQKKLTFYF
ncbi:MAG: DNA polymerase domain-containing protein [Promethearchaeota archaeon]